MRNGHYPLPPLRPELQAAHIRFTWDGLHPASSAVLVMLWPEGPGHAWGRPGRSITRKAQLPGRTPSQVKRIWGAGVNQAEGDRMGAFLSLLNI
ncbi:hypothetical protein CDO47_35730 [Pseudomonas aeruginosa]|nr:hypothetical protein CDO47_35730 [Pseudomonas aeruginosa]